MNRAGVRSRGHTDPQLNGARVDGIWWLRQERHCEPCHCAPPWSMDSSVGLLHPHRGRMATPSHHRLGTPAPGARLATPAYRVSAMTASYSVANSILGGSSRGEWQLTSWSNQPSMGASALDALPRHRMGTPQYAPHAHSHLQSGAMYMPGFEGQHVPARRGDSANTALPSWHGGEVPGRIANASDILQTGGASVPQWGEASDDARTRICPTRGADAC